MTATLHRNHAMSRHLIMNTDSVNIATPEVVNNMSFFNDLHQSLPTAYNMLKAKSDDCDVFSDTHNVRRFMNDSKLKDTPVQLAGLCGKMSFVLLDADIMGSKAIPGYGVTKFVTRRGNIEYVMVHSKTERVDMSWIVVKGENAKALFAYFNKQNEKFNVPNLIDHPPILRDGLLDEIMKNSVDFLEKHGKFAHYGARLSRGLILQGLPGNGKTMACKWITTTCEKAGISVNTVTSSDIERAYKDNDIPYLVNSANVVFFDDVDISFLTRRKGGSTVSDSRLACALLSGMDGVNEMTNGVVRIFTTNEAVVDIDPAFLRPGRIDKVFTFTNPDEVLRRKLIESYWHKDIRDNIDINKLTKQSEGCSFAELDEVKTLLVQEFLSVGNWDLDKAFDEFKHRKNSSGLTKTKKKAKKKT